MYSGHVAEVVSLLWRYGKVEGLLELGVDCEAERSLSSGSTRRMLDVDRRKKEEMGGITVKTWSSF